MTCLMSHAYTYDGTYFLFMHFHILNSMGNSIISMSMYKHTESEFVYYVYILYFNSHTVFPSGGSLAGEKTKNNIYIYCFYAVSLCTTYIDLDSIQSNSKNNRSSIFTLTSSPLQNNIGKKFDGRGV